MTRKQRFNNLRKGSTKKKFWERHGDYSNYLKSREWKKVKKIYLGNRKNPKCAFCKTNKKIEVHHLSYNRLGTASEIKDLMCFCRDHHQEIHRLEKELGCTVRVATMKLLKRKPKKENKWNGLKQSNEKRLLNLRNSRISRELKNEVFNIREQLFLNGIKVSTDNVITLRKLKNKYL